VTPAHSSTNATASTSDHNAPTMAQGSGQKMENLRLVRGDRYAQRPARIFTTSEITLDADMARLFGAVRDANGRAPTRGFRRASLYQESYPWRVLARYIVGAARGNAKEEQVLAIVERLSLFVRETFRKHGHRRAA
jgi:hypothetical protein